MHTHRCVLIEISMEIGMLNFWLGLLVTALIKETYFKGDRLPSIDCSMNDCKTKEIKVVTTNLFHDTTKVHIETLKGTIIANGILTSSICQGYEIGVETSVGVFYEDLLRNHTFKFSTFNEVCPGTFGTLKGACGKTTTANEEYEPESG